MRLNELNIPKTINGAIWHLEKFGWKVIGSGGYASVLGHKDRNYVLKLFVADDNAYISFVKLALKNQDNPHFPKFHHGLINVAPGYKAIRMEKLKPYNGDVLRDKMDELIYKICDYFDLHPKKLHKDAIDKLIKKFSADQPKVITPELMKAIILISRIIVKKSFDNDLNTGNIMWRDRTIVITDPMCSI
jgi:hypothetical protein